MTLLWLNKFSSDFFLPKIHLRQVNRTEIREFVDSNFKEIWSRSRSVKCDTHKIWLIYKLTKQIVAEWVRVFIRFQIPKIKAKCAGHQRHTKTQYQPSTAIHVSTSHSNSFDKMIAKLVWCNYVVSSARWMFRFTFSFAFSVPCTLHGNYVWW